jgi:dipeptidyl aminopeptidase/acylaminoacyl peptidase
MVRIAPHASRRSVSTDTPFHDLKDFVAIPRPAGLRLSPDGSWLAAPVQTLSADGKKYLTSIWRIDPQGGPARRLTRSAEGEGGPRFLPDGSLIFTSRRPDPGADKVRLDAAPGEVAALWLLPPGGGEARIVAALPGGVAVAEAARNAGVVVVSSPVLPEADTVADDERLRKERRDAGVAAILHESAPARFWDHDLVPDQRRLFAVDPERLTVRRWSPAGGTGIRPGSRTSSS